MDTNHGRPGDKIHQLSMNEIDFDNEDVVYDVNDNFSLECHNQEQ